MIPEALDLRRRPLLLPALALWGWQLDLLPLALALGCALEAPRLLPPRLDLSQADCERLWNFTAVIFLGVLLYLGLSNQGLGGFAALTGEAADPAAPTGMRRVSTMAVTFLAWLPCILAPFTLAHAWSRLGALPLATFSLYEQARARRHPGQPPPDWTAWPLHPGHLFAGVTAFSACASTAHPEAFLPLLLLVILLALYPARSPRFAWYLLPPLVGILAGVAWAARDGHHALRDAWQGAEERLLAAVSGGGGGGDQARSRTALGRVGRLKQSGTIVLRVATGDGEPPGLLREAAFDRFRSETATWSVSRPDFTPLPAQTALPSVGRRLTVSRFAGEDGAAPLAVPNGTLAVAATAPAVVALNDLGSWRLLASPPLALATVVSRPGAGPDGRPGPHDLRLGHLAADDLAAVQEAVRELDLAGRPATAALPVLEAWFARGFSYRLWQDRLPEGASPLAHFLRQGRAGHCEYFATAATLILRAAGIPARYAVGFSVQERRDDGLWVGRGRDAHAWCLAWDGGAWQDLDCTPGSWRGIEEARRSRWEGLRDLASDLWHRFTAWRQASGSWRLLVLLGSGLVLGWIGWRQLRGSRWRRAAGGPASPPRPGSDSELPALLARLEARFGARPPHQTPRAWLRRLDLPDPGAWQEVLALHERLRFDPAGLAPRERARLRHLAAGLAVPR